MNWHQVSDYEQMSCYGAECIYERIAAAAKQGRRINLGVATGNTMIGLYRLLAEKLNREQVDLRGLHTYNLDEYVDASGRPVPEDHPLSYRKYMSEKFFSLLAGGLGFGEEQIHFPDPAAPLRFDDGLEAVGGLDFQLLGIGFNGHIAFNEPEDAEKVSRDEFAARPSRIIELKALTLDTNAKLTAGGKLGAVPRHAVTMGMKSILAAREILLLACFSEQQEKLREMRRGDPTPALPASYLLVHPAATVVYTTDKINLR